MTQSLPIAINPQGSISRLGRRFVAALHRLGSDATLQRTVLSIADQAVVSGTNFATSMFLGWCGKSELGVYYLALSILVFLRGIQEQLIVAPYIVYSGRRSGTALTRYAGSSLIHQGLFAGIAMIAVLGMMLAGIGPPKMDSLWLLLLGITPLYLVRDYVRQMSFANLDIRMAFGLDLLISLLQLGLLFPLAWNGVLNVQLVYLAIAFSCGIATLLWFLTKARIFDTNWSAAISDWIDNWRFAKWALATQLVGCSTPYLIPWIVAFVHGEIETGVLGACTTIVGLSNMFLMGVSNFVSPRAAQAFASGGVRELQAVLRTSALIYGTTLGIACLLAFSLGGYVAAVVYGPDFADTRLIIGILSLSVLANSMGITAGNGLCAMDRPAANFWADLVALGAAVAAIVVLVPLWGATGAALATLCSTSTDAAMRWLVLRCTMQSLQAQESAT